MEWTPTPADASARPEVAFNRVAFACASTVFVVFGATASLYGPLLLTFSHRFHLSLPTAGIVLSVHFIGAFCGVPLGWFGVRRLRGNVVLSLTLGLMALGATGAALAHAWPLFLASIFVIGLGFGGIDFTLNSLLVRTPEAGRAHRLSVANAGYGVGSVIGPMLIIATHPHNFPWIFGSVAAAALALALTTRGITAPPLRADAAHVTEDPRRRAVLTTFICAYVLYVATEASAAGWIAPQLHRVGFSQSIGSLSTAGFWLGLAVGRVLAGPLHRRWSDARLVMGGLVVATALALCAYVSAVGPYAYPLFGLAIALVYPMGLIWYTALCPGDGNGLALLILTMMLGGVIGPGVVSAAVSAFGIHSVPVAVASFAALDLAAFASARRFSRTAS
ncbi:MAG: MFS transporter [Acidimicrobiales bacterium]